MRRDDGAVIDGVDGYESGPDATIRAAAAAWARADSARAVVLVEGVSDQIAVEAAARASGVELVRHGVVVVPMGGVHAIGASLRRLAARPDRPLVAGLCDAAEERHVRRAVAAAGLGEPTDRAELARMGFFVCVADLEDELLRAAGRDLVQRVVDVEGDRNAFDTMRAQPAWRDAAFQAQARRFLGAGAGRKLRYAAALVDALGAAGAPAPLRDLLARVTA
jgi:hypothetical protein